jgi:hypothetical protein
MIIEIVSQYSARFINITPNACTTRPRHEPGGILLSFLCTRKILFASVVVGNQENGLRTETDSLSQIAP